MSPQGQVGQYFALSISIEMETRDLLTIGI